MWHHHKHPGNSLILLAALVNIIHEEISIKPAKVSLEKTEELLDYLFFIMGPQIILRFRGIPDASDTLVTSCSQRAIGTFCPMGNFLSGK